MKQTNNAIKFLMAQYRAIFKHAYLKGLVSAAILTAGFATAQNVAIAAEADIATVEDLNNSAKTNFTEDVIEVTATTNNKLWTTNAVASTSGGIIVNGIDDGSSFAISGDGSLTILMSQKDHVFSINPSTGTDTSSGELSIKLSEVNVDAGTLVIGGATATHNTKLFADTFNIGTDDGVGAAVNLGANGTLGLAVIPTSSTDNSLTIGSKGSLNIIASGSAVKAAATATVNVGTLTIDGGILDTIATNADSGDLTINLVKGSMSGSDAKFTVAGSGDVVTLQFASIANEEEIFNVQSGKLSVATGGTLNVSGGVLKLASGTLVSESAGTINVQSGGTLAINSSDLTDTATFKLATATSTLELTDTKQVDLGNLTFNDIGSATAGTIGIAQTANSSFVTIKGDNLIVSKELTDGVNLANIESTSLTLGKEDVASKDLKFNQATTKNVTFLDNDNDFGLLNDIILKNVRSVTDGAGNEIEVGEQGTITGDVTLLANGLIKVDGGIYNANKVTISGGDLTVTNTESNAYYSVESNLTVNNLVLTSNTGNISASGATGNASLTINEIIFDKEVGASGSITATGTSDTAQGIINLQGDQVQKILDYVATQNGSSLPSIQIKAEEHGVINIDDSISLDLNPNNQETLGRVLDVAEGGFINAESITFKMKEVDAAGSLLNFLNFGGTLQADNISVDARKTDGNIYDKALYLIGGNIIVNSSLTANNGTTHVVSKRTDVDSVLQFGNITPIEGTSDRYQASTSGGSINVDNLVVSKDSSNPSFKDSYIKVEAGAWTGHNILVSDGGQMTVGSTVSGTLKDINDNTITASFTGDKLTTSGASSSFKVNSNGSATFNGLDTTSGGSVNIDGAMTIKGGTVDTDNSNEVKLASGSINVNTNGYLTFEQGALTNSIMTGNAVKDTVKESINLLTNGTVKLNFASGSFNIAELTQLKKDLFKNEDSNGNINGVLHIGDAKIGDLNIKNNTIAWSDYKPVSDVASDVTNNELITAKVTGVDTAFKGHVGSVESTTQRLEVDGNSSFNSASDGFYVSYKGTAADLVVNNGSDIALNGGGQIGNVSLYSGSGDDAVLTTSGKSITTIASVNGDATSEFTASAEQTVVEKNVTVGDFNTKSGSSTHIKGNLTTNATDSTTEINGKLVVDGNATAAGYLEVGGTANVNGNLTAAKKAGVYGNTTVGGTATLNSDFEVAEGALFKTKAFVAAGTNNVYAVGEDDYTNENGELVEGTPGYLETDTFKLNGNNFVVDPAYGKKTSIAAIKSFNDTATTYSDSGVVNGNVILGQNAGLMVGKDATVAAMQEFLAQYQDANGSLKEDEVGAVFLLNDKLALTSGSQIIIDSTRSKDEILGTTGSLNSGAYKAKYDGNVESADLYIGSNSVLAVGERTLEQGAAIHFESTDAHIMAQDNTSKIVLVGDNFINSRTITLFTDAGSGSDTANGVKVLGEQDILVESLNGLMFFTLDAGTETTGGTLQFNAAKAQSAFTNASAPIRQNLLAYASGVANYDEYYADPDNVEKVELVGDVADKNIATYDETNGVKITNAGNIAGYTENDFVVVDGVLYNRGFNAYLEQVTRDSASGIEGDQAARLSAFGGAAQAALTAGATTYDAISGRMGVGAQTGAITFADNGQGAGLWVSPIYKNHDSDGFGAQGISYGVDMDMFGLALGGDFTMANGLRVGATFNVGSGDADGQGAGAGVSNEFDYYGFGIYAGYTMDNLSVVADVSYTVVDNSLEASNSVDKISASTDTSSLSVGVTGQYALDFNGMNVVPHAGLRYTNIDMDDYTVSGAKYGEIAHYSADSLGVFSIPVGVTFSKDIVAGAWTVKPAFDVTLTANMGDDSVEGNVDWTGLSNLGAKVESEVMDSFTYGATLGVSAKTGNFSMGFGVNYTGASNADEYGVNANARFVF